MLVSRAARALAWLNSSMIDRVKAREVSFTSVMASFVMEGITRLMTWGRMILIKVCDLLYPSILAASYCPWGMDSIPPLYISAK